MNLRCNFEIDSLDQSIQRSALWSAECLRSLNVYLLGRHPDRCRDSTCLLYWATYRSLTRFQHSFTMHCEVQWILLFLPYLIRTGSSTPLASPAHSESISQLDPPVSSSVAISPPHKQQLHDTEVSTVPPPSEPASLIRRQLPFFSQPFSRWIYSCSQTGMRSPQIWKIIDAVIDKIMAEHQPLSGLVPRSWGYDVEQYYVDFRINLMIANDGAHENFVYGWVDLI